MPETVSSSVVALKSGKKINVKKENLKFFRGSFYILKIERKSILVCHKGDIYKECSVVVRKK